MPRFNSSGLLCLHWPCGPPVGVTSDGGVHRSGGRVRQSTTGNRPLQFRQAPDFPLRGGRTEALFGGPLHGTYSAGVVVSEVLDRSSLLYRIFHAEFPMNGNQQADEEALRSLRLGLAQMSDEELLQSTGDAW
jgi:hypothetical protein